MTSRCALRPVSLPSRPEEDWSRRLNCRPPLPVFSPASSSARWSCGASWRNIDSVSGFSTVKCEVTWPLRSTSMRTSMRPRSAGSSLISKRLLPLFAETAISSASPLNGTAAFVAAVTFNGPTGAAAAAAEWSCGWIAPVACAPMSVGSAAACPVSVTAEWSRADMLVAMVDEELVEGLSGFIPSIPPLPGFGLPATAGPCATPLRGEPVDIAVAEGSAVPGAVSGSLDAVVPAWATPAVLVVTFGATDAVAATAAVNSAPVAAVASACVAGWLTGVAVVSLAAWTVIFAVAAASAVVALAAADAVAAVALASILVCAADAAGASVAAELAAIAAAAIASGSVALPDAGEAAGTFAAATVTGIATATGFGVVTAGPSCWAGAAGSATEAASAWAVGASSEFDFAVDFASSVFEAPDLVLERWTASVCASALV